VTLDRIIVLAKGKCISKEAGIEIKKRVLMEVGREMYMPFGIH
jgi:hypothetical protein